MCCQSFCFFLDGEGKKPELLGIAPILLLKQVRKHPQISPNEYFSTIEE